MTGSTSPRGVCASCANARELQSARGSHFLLCTLAASDSRYARYPPLPVVACSGYREGTMQSGGEPEE